VSTQTLDFAHLAKYRPDLVDAATAWALDCEWEDSIENLSGETILRSVHRHYDGGLSQLARDCYLDEATPHGGSVTCPECNTPNASPMPGTDAEPYWTCDVCGAWWNESERESA
jgi:hypothetical protein